MRPPWGPDGCQPRLGPDSGTPQGGPRALSRALSRPQPRSAPASGACQGAHAAFLGAAGGRTAHSQGLVPPLGRPKEARGPSAGPSADLSPALPLPREHARGLLRPPWGPRGPGRLPAGAWRRLWDAPREARGPSAAPTGGTCFRRGMGASLVRMSRHTPSPSRTDPGRPAGPCEAGSRTAQGLRALCTAGFTTAALGRVHAGMGGCCARFP